MCGVIGLRCQRDRADLGRIASGLLRTLEYRGYDSTGAAIQDECGRVTLKKDVGSPTVVTEKLGIYALSGRVFCGQVRWATFGTVTQENAQPHEVRCKTHLYGAHNGNITNCDQLKTWLEGEGHHVVSDNDGEMLIHVVEHFFARALAELDGDAAMDAAARGRALKSALVAASKKLTGSFAAVVVDPMTQNMAAIKAGSSLYMGVGVDPEHGDFIIACSDLSAVLSMTNRLLPIKENEFCVFNEAQYDFYRLSNGEKLGREPVTSALSTEETRLHERYQYFMEQEIHSQPAAAQKLIDGYRHKSSEFAGRVARFADILYQAHKRRNAIYCVACGTSFNAAKTGAIFFNQIAGVNIAPMLPGDFRAQCSRAVANGDVVIGVSQSGETKDLIDIFNQIELDGVRATCITMVNNMNSTLALEKSDLCVPLMCGVEIAVPATKSFINQLLVFYVLALHVAEQARDADQVKAGWDALTTVPALIETTIDQTRAGIEAVAEALYLAPSLHILATGMQGIAREGALKVREVVLNHTEGYEGTEFKHGPNTILGVNTVFGFKAIEKLCGHLGARADDLAQRLGGRPMDREGFAKLFADYGCFGDLYSNYPLLFVTGPEARDVNLTISQINTHKIRGANIFIIAEEDKNLRHAVTKAPMMGDRDAYVSGYIVLPQTGSQILAQFSSAVVLQLLALNMSVKKMAYLDALKVQDHGVHPDTPKNVSKSITVD